MGKALMTIIAGTIILWGMIEMLAVGGRNKRLRQDKTALLEWEGEGGSI